LRAPLGALAGTLVLVGAGLASGAHAETAPLSAYDQAVADRQAGRIEKAIGELKELSAQTPKDADVWLNLGLAYTAKGDFADAEAALKQGLALAPAYADLQIAYARLAYFKGRRAEAHARLNPVLAAAPTNTDAQELSKELLGADREASADAWRVDTAFIYTRLSSGLAPWTEWDGALSRRLASNTTLTLDIEQTSRFSEANTYLSGVVNQRLGATNIFIGFGGSPDATYRAQDVVQGGAVAPPLHLGGGWSLVGEVDGSWARYPSGDVTSFQPVASLIHGDAFSLSGRYIYTYVTPGLELTGYIIRADAAVVKGLHVNAAYAYAPDSSAGVTILERTYSAGASFLWPNGYSLNLTFAHETTSHYSLDQYALGVTRRF
jgi:YaiO family outer membrane protein